MEKPRIKLDIDGVIRNMNKPMIDLYNQRYNTNISEDDVNDYDVAKSFPKIKEIDGISAFDFFFKIHIKDTTLLAPIYHGAKEAVDKLHEKFEIHIVSYQPTYVAQNYTIEWLENNCIQYDSITFTTQPTKSIIQCAYVIDDCPKYLRENLLEYSICINKPYNQDAMCDLRADSLKEVAEKLVNLVE